MDKKNNSAAEKPQNAAAPADNAGRKTADLPRRRVGSITLGVCLIAAGVFFLLYYFLPEFNWMLALKIAPAAGLMLMGCEVLFFAVRPGHWKYDFALVLICLCLIGVCFCMTLLPLFWAEIDPARQRTQEKLRDEYVSQVYDEMQRNAPQCTGYFAERRAGQLVSSHGNDLDDAGRIGTKHGKRALSGTGRGVV